jgi:hypothetical protein
MDTDEGARRGIEKKRRFAPILLGDEVVRADGASWHDLGEERTHEIHVLVVPASFLIPPRSVGEKVVPAGVPIAGPKLRPGKRHQEEYAHVSLEIEREVERIPAEGGAGASETRFCPPGRPGRVDDPYAVDEGKSSGDGLVPAPDRELEPCFGECFAEELERGKGRDEVAEAIEPQSEDALDASNVGAVAPGPQSGE